MQTTLHLITTLKTHICHRLMFLLGKAVKRLFNWFTCKSMKANAEKCHLLLSTYEKLSANFGNVNIENNRCNKLQGIQIDNKLTFEKHLNDLLKKSSQKLNAVSRIFPYRK